MDFDIKYALGLAAAAVAVVNYLPYLIGVYRKTLKPHAFSWIIWTLMTSITFFAQVADNAGPGAWAAGATAVTLFLIAIMSFRNKGYRVKTLDKFSFVGALFAIPAWIATANPLVAVVIVTFIETLGFLPTYRKAYRQPHDESVTAFSLTILKYSLALMALENYSATTMLFPVALIVLSTIFVVEVTWRRRLVSPKS